MYSKSQTVAYALAIFVLMNGLFVLSDSNPRIRHSNDTNAFKQEVRQEFAKAFVQTVGDQPWFSDFEIALSGIFDFYDQSTTAMVALLDPRGADDDMIAVGRQVYLAFAQSFYNANGKVAGEQIEWEYNPVAPSLGASRHSLPEGESYIEPTLEPIYNIVP